ncbi:MAG: type pilus biosis ATPase PilM [Fibrobacteres bacterium]|nr:type pilus biosis ATPase PilM [Fibrobacterota bacterium]
MAKKNSSVVALELSRSFLKLVEFLPAENQISTVAIKPLDAARWDDDAYLAEQVRHSVSKHVSEPDADLVTAMSGENAVIRQVEVPNSEDNIIDAIEWEMEQYLIHPLEEYLLDYQSLGSNLDETARTYLVAAYRRSEVERFKRIMEQSGCNLAILDLDVFAAQNVYEANYPEKLPLKTFLIKADSNVIKCIRTQNGQFLGFESITVDAAFMTSGSEAKAELVLGIVNQVRASLDRAQDAWGGVDQIVLCGDLALDNEFREMLEANMTSEITHLNAFKEITFALSPEKSAVFQPSAPQCAGAVGLALRRRGDS